MISAADKALAEGVAEAPQHQHDCSACIFLGRYGDQDLYFHDGGDQPILTTVIARHGPDGQYSSGLPFAASIPALGEALARARAAGFGPAIDRALCRAVEGVEPLRLHPFVLVFSGNGRREAIEVYAANRDAAREQHRCMSPARTQPVAYTPEEAAALGIKVRNPEVTFAEGQLRAAMGLPLHPQATDAARRGFDAAKADQERIIAQQMRQPGYGNLTGAF